MRLTNERGSLGIVALLMTLAIIGLLAYFYFEKKPEESQSTKDTSNFIEDAGLSTENQFRSLQTTKSKLKEIEQQKRDMSQQLFGD